MAPDDFVACDEPIGGLTPARIRSNRTVGHHGYRV
jgi:hypothetical protein